LVKEKRIDCCYAAVEKFRSKFTEYENINRRILNEYLSRVSWAHIYVEERKQINK